MPAALQAALLLVLSNAFMTYAWYGHLRDLAAKPWYVAALFAWGAFAGVRRHPFGLLFTRFVRPRLAPPEELEDPRPPTFAQGVGFAVTIAGVILGASGVELAVPIAASLAFVAAFLNAVFAYCLGCQLYLLLVRARVIPRT